MKGPKIRATHFDDPFPMMIEWLEAIADGAGVARWLIGEEGSVAQFIFSGRYRTGIDLAPASLAYLRVSEHGYGISHDCVPVSRRALVKSFYESFRTYTEGDLYEPDEWERGPLPSIIELEHSACDYGRWDGESLRELRSGKVARYVSSQPEQLSFWRESWSAAIEGPDKDE